LGLTAPSDGELALMAEEASPWVRLAMVEDVLNLARANSLWPLTFGLACCAIEMMAAGASRYDLDRFGAALPRFSPRQADLLMVVGTVNCKQAPILRRVFEQMADPKWVIAFGVCASSGGFYDNYATVQGIDRIVPVDVYIPGCPPRPEQVLDGIILLQRKIQDQGHRLIDREPPPLQPVER